MQTFDTTTARSGRDLASTPLASEPRRNARRQLLEGQLTKLQACLSLPDLQKTVEQAMAKIERARTSEALSG